VSASSGPLGFLVAVAAAAVGTTIGASLVIWANDRRTRRAFRQLDDAQETMRRALGVPRLSWSPDDHDWASDVDDPGVGHLVCRRCGARRHVDVPRACR
jgi:type II secretory pathway pseudopilin PulG